MIAAPVSVCVLIDRGEKEMIRRGSGDSCMDRRLRSWLVFLLAMQGQMLLKRQMIPITQSSGSERVWALSIVSDASAWRMNV